MPDENNHDDKGVHSAGYGSADIRYELANRLFFRLYQSANMLHKVGTKAVESEGLTTQRWAVLGALSRPDSNEGLLVGDLARYLSVSRQSLAGVVRRLEDDNLISSEPDQVDGRARRLRMTSHGSEVWNNRAVPLIRDFYDGAVAGLSVEDMSHALHYIVRLTENMEAIGDPPSNNEAPPEPTDV